jgi:hypothetical protein
LFSQAASPGATPPSGFDALFNTSDRGYREILLVIVLARLTDPEYDPRKDFYACNPRAVYEQVVRDALTARRIPRGQSGPLNIAKGTQGIDATWAARRKSPEAARALLGLLERLMPLGQDELRRFTVSLLARFLLAASEAATHHVAVDPQADPLALLAVCEALIRQAPDRGNTPQRIVGLLLDVRQAHERSGVTVHGQADSASVTSRTGKKPGDIWEAGRDGKPLRVYEVTVKPFTAQRMEEACDSLAAWCAENGATVPEVTVLCRPEDVPVEATAPALPGLLLGVAEQRGVRFVFADLFLWVAAELVKLPPDGRILFDRLLSDYIADPNTVEGVKRLWRSLREDSDEPLEPPSVSDPEYV